MVNEIDIGPLSKHIEKIEKWVGETQTGFFTDTGPKTPAEFLASTTEIRSSGKEIFKAVAKPDATGMATDALIKMFQQVVIKHEDEVRERIIGLVTSGEKSPLAYYAMILEFVKQESSIAELLPSPDKIKEDLGGSFMARRGCPSCSACSACIACAASIAAAAGAAGVAGVYFA